MTAGSNLQSDVGAPPETETDTIYEYGVDYTGTGLLLSGQVPFHRATAETIVSITPGAKLIRREVGPWQEVSSDE